MDNPTTIDPQKTPSGASPEGAPETGSWRRVAGNIISIGAVLGAVVLGLWVWSIIERHPRTDDATVQANVVGIAPRVRGQIIELNVEDNEAVDAGDVLFVIDPEDYELELARAKAALATLDQQIEVARSQDAQLEFQITAAQAGVKQARAELKQATDTLERMRPLLGDGFVTAEDVDRAATAKKAAAAALAVQEQRLNEAQVALSGLATLVAERLGAEAAVELAELHLSYCEVKAPFPGRVISLKISEGAFANAGVPVFSLLDTRKWYVMASFREGEIRHLAPGTKMDIHLPAAPGRRFTGRVQGIGWAVAPSGEINLPHGVPIIRRELNWVHIAQRFPVRIEVEDPDPDLFRMGATAVASVSSSSGSSPRP